MIRVPNTMRTISGRKRIYSAAVGSTKLTGMLISLVARPRPFPPDLGF